VYNRSYDIFKFFKNFPIGTIVFFSIFQINQLNIKFKFSHPKSHILGWKRVVWRIDRWDTSSRFCCMRRQEKKGKGREGTQSHKTLYFSYLWVGHPWADSHKIWHACCPRNVINVSNFCNNIFRGFRSTGGQSPRFPIDFAGHRYNSAALTRSLW